MTIFRTAVVGDIGDKRYPIIDGFADLIGVASVKTYVKRPGFVAAELETIVLDPVERKLEVRLGGSGGWLNTEARGDYDYEMEYELTWTNGDVITVPDNEPDILPVRRQRG